MKKPRIRKPHDISPLKQTKVIQTSGGLKHFNVGRIASEINKLSKKGKI